jgi:hypothetical protein
VSLIKHFLTMSAIIAFSAAWAFFLVWLAYKGVTYLIQVV